MISALFGKKRIAEDKLANAFVNAVLEFTEQGFPLVCAELNEAPEFEVSPGIEETNDEPFARILLAGNLIEMQRTLGPGVDKRMYALSVSKFANAMGVQASDLDNDLRQLLGRMERMNYPSKNTVYAMAKVVFTEYDLFCFQDVYFREQKSPNPIVLKRLNSLMGYFLWSWSEVSEQYRIV